MKKKQLLIALCFFTMFVIFTISVCKIDVKLIGAQQTDIGYATINILIHNLTGVNMTLYTVTNWLELVPIATILFFAVIGLIQWIKRKNFLKVDFNILMLGSFYIVVAAVYLFFENFVINYRPILINGFLEASYPSSTTMLVMCIMPTTITQLKIRLKSKKIREILSAIIYIFIAFMIFARIFSGVHWITDIIGGMLISTSLVTAYNSICNLKL